MKTQIKIIKFNPATEEIARVVKPPVPSSKNTPEWYKKIPKLNGNKYNFDADSSVNNQTVKACAPFWDSLTAGYAQNTWTELYLDISINNNLNHINLRYATTPEIVSSRPSPSFDIPEEYYPIEFIWKMPWIPETPQGYSSLIVHPLNQIDLPFFTLSGIIDTDNFTQSRHGANLPFYIKKSFTGLIQIDTPMYQIIPFKRENWKSLITEYSEIKNKKIHFNVHKYFTNGYKRSMWKRKQYE